MGVMACNRAGCENILCDKYSCTHGYICNECYGELASRSVPTKTEEFMESHKQMIYDIDVNRARLEQEFFE